MENPVYREEEPVDLSVDPCHWCGGDVEEIRELIGPEEYFDYRCLKCGSDAPYFDD